MGLNVCVVCRKVFSRISSLTRHTNNRQTSCHPPTHYCKKCDKGLSSYQKLWEHRRKCLSTSVEKQPTKVLNDSTVSSDNFADQSTSLQLHTLASKDDEIDSTELTPSIYNHVDNIPSPPQKKVPTLSRLNDSVVPVTLVYSDEEDDHKGGGDIKQLFSLLDEDIKRLLTSLGILSKFIGVGYTRFGPAIVDTIEELYRLDAITEGQYQRLTEVFHQFL